MRRSKAIAASLMALTLALGGGLAYAAGSDSSASASSSVASDQASSSGVQQDKHGKFAGKRGGFAQLAGLESKLADYLKLSAEELKTKLETSTLAEVGAAQGIGREDLKAKLVEWIDAAAAAAPKKDVKAAQGDSIKKPDSSAIADKLLDSKGFAAAGKGFAGKGHGHGAIAFGNKEALAKLLGLTSAELKTALKDGQTLAAIADKQGVSLQSVIDLGVNAVKAKLEEALASGKLTQEEYDAKLQAVTDEVTKQVNGEWEAPKGVRGGFGGGAHFGGGHGGKLQGEAGKQAAPAASSSTMA
ncbi:hypothetical protein PghCCS26_05910 [Paenibacillus glycanilyticus]|uniref:Uncharacterized protein n=1 Tax=Paenibacillus glycanilyticus TaxID=126569 RepID=A0ABQ6NFE0_9BACL|nr:hypothetical protein [Paenibacillus glycanilyticus]GMK43464.1 hypothetical protein PghCCS26_05910 [Paenibacillus glycanilyticus]